MKTRRMIIAALLVVSQAAWSEPASIELASGSGSFAMPGGFGRENSAIRVHYHRPANFSATSRILIVVPGAGRNGDSYRDSWVAASEKHSVLVLSPTYPEEDYDLAGYHFGGIVRSLQLGDFHVEPGTRIYRVNDAEIRFDIADDPRTWLFNDFDRLFAIAVASTKSRQERYDVFGHSAGAQILHRFALFMPGSRADRMIAANSGFYTLPRLDEPLPFGVGGTRVTQATLRQSFATKLVLLLGELDDANEKRGIHLRSRKADLQGIGRFARGNHFHEEARRVAAGLDAPFAWRVEVVPAVGHDQQKMAEAAARLLYGE